MDQPFECSLCEYSVADHSTFVDHLAFHQQSKVIQCPFCPLESNVSTMRFHMLKHRATEMFDCSSCEFSSNSVKSLNHHAQAHHHQQQFKCEYCKKLMTKHSLIKHWDEVHGIREVSAQSAKESDVQWGDRPMSTPASSCSMFYPEVVLKSEDAQHQDDMSPIRLETQGVNVAESIDESETGDLADDEIETFSCKVCEFSSHLKVLLKYHILSMHTKKVACKNCSALMTKHALIQHSKNVHGSYIYFDGKGLREASFQSIKPEGSHFPSKDCIKSKNIVRNPKEREITAKILRSGDKFICSVCKYSTPQKMSLLQHIDNLHRRKFCCSNCPAIMTKFALVEHARLEHGCTLKLKNRYIVEAKPGGHSSSGSGSEEEYVYGSEIEPERTDGHSKSTRVEISRTIANRGNLFSCSICKYSSSWRPHLEKHIEKLHVKKYHCKHCPEVMNKYDLIEHAMTMHGVTMSIKTPGLKEFRHELDEASQEMDQGWENMDDQEPSDTEFHYNQYDTSNPFGAHDHSYITGGKPGKPFACSICDFTAHNEWSLTCHMKFLHKVKYHCNHCPEVMTKHDIIKHSWDKHGVEIRPRGPSGLKEAREDVVSQGDIQNFSVAEGTTFSGDQFMGHFLDDTQTQSVPDVQKGTMKAHDPTSCSICGFVGKYPSNLSVHMDLFHRRTFCCPHCPAVMSKHDLMDHSWSAHGIMFKPKNRHLKEIVQTSNDSDDEMAHCDNDDSEYEPSTLSLQDKIPSKKACSHCDYVARNSDKIKIHVERMHTRKYHCEHCMVVMTKYDLINHYTKEHGHVLGSAYRYYQFKRADEVTNEQALQDRVTDCDGEPSEYKLASQSFHGQKSSKPVCLFCGYTAVYNSNILDHVQRMHVNKYHCEHCSMVMSKYDLIRHYKNEHSIVIPLNLRRYPFKKACDFMDGQESADQAVGTESKQETAPGSSSLQNKNASNAPRKGCLFCKYSSVVPKDIMIHEERMHRLKYHCEHCPVVMVKYDLLQHCKIEHGIVRPNNYRFKEAANVIEQDEDQMDVIQSDEKYLEFEEPSFHQNIASKQVCSVCGYIGPESSMGVHMERLHTIQFRCRYCSVVMTKYELIKHYKSAHGFAVSRFGNFIHSRDAVVPQSGKLDAGTIHSFAGKTETPEMCESGQIGEDRTESIQLDKDCSEPEELSSQGNNASKKGCSICGYVGQASHMEIHLERMHRKKFHCEHCSIVMTKHELVQHYKVAHDITISKFGRKVFIEASDATESQSGGEARPVLAVKSENYEANDHDSSSFSTDRGNFSCPLCDFSTKTGLSLEAHTEKWHRYKYLCNNCPEVMTKHEMIEHSKNIHGFFLPKIGRPIQLLKPAEQDLESGGSQQANSSFTVDPANGTFKCNKCDFSSQYRKSMVHHVISLHRKKYSCDHCSAILTKHELILHSRDVHGISIPWNGRGYVLKQVAQDDPNNESETSNSSCLLRSKHEDKDKYWVKFVQADGTSHYKCTKCEFSSLYSFNVKGHAESYHSKLFCCDTCPAVMTKYDLIEHYENEHNVVFSNPKAQRGPRFVEYHPRLGQTETAHCVSRDTDQEVSTNAENILTGCDNDESEFINSVGVRPNSTLKPENSGKQDGEPDQFMRVEGISEMVSCTICDFSSKYRQALRPHFEKLHMKTFSCSTCSVVMTKYDLIQHYKNVHNVTIQNYGRGYSFKEVNEGPEQVSHDTDDESEVSCFAGIRRRSAINHEISSEHADEQDESAYIKQNGDDFICSSCGFSSKYRYSLQSHLEALHQKKYGCNRCSVILSKYDMIQHYETEHDVVISSKISRSLKYFKEVDHASEGIGESILTGNVADSSVQGGFSTTEIPDDDGGQSMNIIQDGGKSKCSICGFSSLHKCNLKPHFYAFHQKKYCCNRCPIILTKHEMILHYETEHDVLISSSGPSSMYFKEVDHTPEGIDESASTGDVANSSVQGGPSTREFYAEDEVQSMTILHEGGEFKCSICPFSTVHRFNFKPHFEAFHQKKYSCNRCSVVMTKYGMVCHYETTHRFVIPNFGKGSLRPYCSVVGEHSDVKDLPDFADGIVEMDDPLTIEVDDIAAGMVETVMDDPSRATFDRNVQDESVEMIIEGGEFKCPICAFSSSYKGNMRAHIEALHQKKYSCNCCSLIKTKYDMIRHYETDHNMVISSKGHTWRYFKDVDQEPEVRDSSANDTVESSVMYSTCRTESKCSSEGIMIIKEGDEFKCSTCEYSSDVKQNAGLHLESHHRKLYSCNQCSAVMNGYEMVQHYKNDHAVIIPNRELSQGNLSQYFKTVNQAPKVTGSSSLANDTLGSNWMPDIRHSTAKTGTDVGADIAFIFKDGKEFRCSICDYLAQLESSVEKHVASLHKKKFSCNRCSVVMTKYDMVQHFENDHGVEIPHKGRGLTTHYFTAVDQNSDVADLEHNELRQARGAASTVATENDSDVPVSEQNEFKCTKCHFSTKWTEDLRTHTETFHPKNITPLQSHFKEPYHVPDDPTSFVGGEYTISAGGSQDDGNLACCVCDFSSKYSYSMETHMVNMHKRKFACQLCPTVLTKYALIKHYENVHGMNISPFNRTLREVTSPTVGPDDGGRTCGEESSSSEGSSALKKVDESSRSSNDHPGPSSCSSAPMTGGVTTFSCSFCDFSSRLRMHLQVHKRTMHSSKHSCNLCSAVMTKHELLSHHKNVHGTPSSISGTMNQSNQDSRRDPEEDTQDCVTVEQPTASMVGLTDDPNRFKCTLCEFSTHLRHSLTSHMESLHTQKYHCNHCPAVMTKHELMSHSADVHGVYIHVRGYSLKEAKADSDSSKEYGDVSDVEALQARNTFTCPTCDFTTKAKWYLKSHMDKFHRRKYCCTHCSAVMTRHVLVKHCKNVHGLTYSSRQPLTEAVDLNSTSSKSEESHKHWNYAGPSTISGPTEGSIAKSSAKQAVGDEICDKAQCSKCDFSTPHKSYLKEHMENFHRRKYSCRQCSAVMTKYELRKHSVERHNVTTGPPSASHMVSKPDENHAKSKYKMMSEFKKPKRFPCDKCPFSSFHGFGLKRHIKLHHTIKYPCQHCPVVMTRYALIKHCRNMHSTQILENQPNTLKSDGDAHSSKPTLQPTGENSSNYFSMEDSQSQVINPKFQAQQRTDVTTTVQSPAFQPVVVLEKLPIEVDDLDSTFSVIDNTKATDSAMVKNPKFHDRSSQPEY